jgi:hypothetical protein
MKGIDHTYYLEIKLLIPREEQKGRTEKIMEKKNLKRQNELRMDNIIV